MGRSAGYAGARFSAATFGGAAGTLCVLCTLGMAAAAPGPFRPDAAKLIECERALTHDAAALGVRDAFLLWLSPTAVVFHPDPRNGKAVYTELGPSPARFAREPWKSVMSASRDLGWTNGQWTFKADSTQATIDVYGDYATVWQRQDDGSWKVEFDAGVQHAPPDMTPEALAPVTLTPGPGGGTAGDSVLALQAMRAMDAEYAAAAAKDGAPAALEHFGAKGVIVLRKGVPRLVGASAARDSLAGRENSVTLVSLAQFAAAAGDLGYTYGSFVVPAPAADSSYYLHIWQRGRKRPWELMLEYVQPVPKRGG